MLLAQQAAIPAASSEMATRSQTVKFRAAVQLVTIPVVVRDGQGRAAGHLAQSDFEIFDNGKRQLISKFSIERSAGSEARTAPAAGRGPSTASRPAANIPERYTAYVFDDIHLGAAELMRVRDAAGKRFATTLGPADRAAIYSMSGQIAVDFTADQEILRAGLARLMPHPMRSEQRGNCPEISFYQADLIVNRNDGQAMTAAMADARVCTPGGAADSRDVMMVARRVLSAGDQESRRGIMALHDAIRGLEVMAGQRSIILVSPGFLNPGEHPEETELMQYAVQANVTINALDARGLWTGSVDASQRGESNPDAILIKSSYASSRASAETGVMAELAANTGGRFLENSNNLETGFQQLAATPEFVYVLGFVPQNLKLDGKYHPLKVKLAAPKGLNVQARLGYFAPKRLNDPDEQAKEEVTNAVLSREELRELPADLLARAIPQPAGTDQIIARAHIFLKDLKLRLADGRSCNEIRFAAALFDANGKLVDGQEQTVDLKLSSETLAKTGEHGIINLHSDFLVKRGSYLVRMVLRDAEGEQITAQNIPIEAP
jgi:VWFA-related protein